MLYPKNKAAALDDALFRNPTSEYRGAPFWAWNCRLDPAMLRRQIEYLKEMGFGGFHMHSRTGMATPYLSGEFMDLVKTCVEKARDEQMLAWLYDEDRWPSGSAGGLVTKNPAYRARHLRFQPAGSADGQPKDGETLLARYEVTLDENGCLQSYAPLDKNAAGDNAWEAWRVINSAGDPWYNNQCYVNTLDKAAIDEFIRVTYESYEKAAGKDFGSLIPAIFTDEPQFNRKQALGYASEKRAVTLPWTDDLPETFRAAYGEELIPHLPELFWELPRGQVSLVRYHFHDHIAQRFADAFANNCGGWCRKHNLMLTGHMMEEPRLESQTAALGEAMRSYTGFDLPGIDMLCDWREYTTAKQAQSAVHQFGREGMLSELYGVTNWDFDFRRHKLQGDWQAALGVTVRVPHLSWVSMGGEAKRDYPASISYQSPWFREYPLVENHFARVAAAMTRGRPLVRVGVVHPVESYWLHWGPSEQTAGIREEMDARFQSLTDWLLFGQIDFDFISESLLPSQCPEGGAPLRVGEMAYDAVIVPSMETICSTTLERLRAFQKQGGRLLVLGRLPRWVDAREPGGRLDFLESAALLPFDATEVLDALEPVREVDIRDSEGKRTRHLLTQLRQDGGDRWLFVANGRALDNPDLLRPFSVTLRVAGEWQAELYDTLTGEIYRADTEIQNGRTVLRRTLFNEDSLLLHLTKAPAHAKAEPPRAVLNGEGRFAKAAVTLSEPNALLLDMAEYAFDDGDYQPAEEILRIDNRFRAALGLPSRRSAVAQPWVVPPETPAHRVRLRFTIPSELAVQDAKLALEDAVSTAIRLNGQIVPSAPDGWYVDEAIQTVPLPGLAAGVNILELEAPFGRRTNLEWCYLLGDFGVRAAGFEKTITAPVRELAFDNIVPQGLPFYGGNILYKIPVESKGGSLTVEAPRFRGALIGVLLDGKRVGSLAFDPYTLTIPSVSAGTHELGLLYFGTRINTFGAVHNCDESCRWHGPDAWRTTGDHWCYEYYLYPQGILRSPSIISEKA